MPTRSLPFEQIEFHVADAIAFRGLAYWNKGDLERALSDFDEAIRLKPGDEEIRAWREKLVKDKAGRK